MARWEGHLLRQGAPGLERLFRARRLLTDKILHGALMEARGTSAKMRKPGAEASSMAGPFRFGLGLAGLAWTWC
jgi:hypothetical protein